MGKDQELIEAARNGDLQVIDKILTQRAKRSGPLARSVSLPLLNSFLPYSCLPTYIYHSDSTSMDVDDGLNY